MITFSFLLYFSNNYSKDKIIRNHYIDYKFLENYIVKDLINYKNVNIIDMYSGYIGHLLKFRTNKIISRGYDPLNTKMNKEFLKKLK